MSADHGDEPRTTKPRVRAVLGQVGSRTAEAKDDLPDAQLDMHIDDAHSLVQRRVGPYISARATPSPADEHTLEELERYVAAHYAMPTLTGSADGSVVSSKSAADVSISYDTDASTGPDGRSSAHWRHAVDVDPTGRLAKRVRSPSYYRADEADK